MQHLEYSCFAQSENCTIATWNFPFAHFLSATGLQHIVYCCAFKTLHWILPAYFVPSLSYIYLYWIVLTVGSASCGTYWACNGTRATNFTFIISCLMCWNDNEADLQAILWKHSHGQGALFLVQHQHMFLWGTAFISFNRLINGLWSVQITDLLPIRYLWKDCPSFQQQWVCMMHNL